MHGSKWKYERLFKAAKDIRANAVVAISLRCSEFYLKLCGLLAMRMKELYIKPRNLKAHLDVMTLLEALNALSELRKKAGEERENRG
ncbi:MAG: hypothetical protein KJ714_05300 [Euryarchaeota archaeon]|nr:hypothetical protein [Euryarchaeota archaeon]